MIESPLHIVESVVRELPEVVAAYVFGSVARGEAGAKSDVDVAVLYAQRPPRSLSGPVAQLHRRLERALDREVDLIVLNDAPPDLVHRVLRDGVLVHERDRAQRIAFEVKVRNVYWDLLPYLQRYRRAAS